MDSSRPHPIARALTDALSPSDRTDRTVAVEGMSFGLRYAPEPGVDLLVQVSEAGEPDETVVVTIFEAAADRPPEYPPELPYLPGVKVSVMAPADRPHAWAMWMLDDVESALAGMLAQSETAGWVAADEADDGAFPPGMRTIVLTRPGRCRTIVAASFGADSMITVMDNADGE